MNIWTHEQFPTGQAGTASRGNMCALLAQHVARGRRIGQGRVILGALSVARGSSYPGRPVCMAGVWIPHRSLDAGAASLCRRVAAPSAACGAEAPPASPFRACGRIPQTSSAHGSGVAAPSRAVERSPCAPRPCLAAPGREAPARALGAASFGRAGRRVGAWRPARRRHVRAA